jgi:hypothetical protein
MHVYDCGKSETDMNIPCIIARAKGLEFIQM